MGATKAKTKEATLIRLEHDSNQTLYIKTEKKRTTLGMIVMVCDAPKKWAIIGGNHRVIDADARYDTADEAFDVLFDLSKNYIRSAL